MRKTTTWLIGLALILTLGSIRGFAQANSELTGTVTDTTGAVVSGASSGSTGLYDFPGLNPGNYNLKSHGQGLRDLYAERHRGQRIGHVPR
jgi:hypothetical protein